MHTSLLDHHMHEFDSSNGLVSDKFQVLNLPEWAGRFLENLQLSKELTQLT